MEILAKHHENMVSTITLSAGYQVDSVAVVSDTDPASGMGPGSERAVGVVGSCRRHRDLFQVSIERACICVTHRADSKKILGGSVCLKPQATVMTVVADSRQSFRTAI